MLIKMNSMRIKLLTGLIIVSLILFIAHFFTAQSVNAVWKYKGGLHNGDFLNCCSSNFTIQNTKLHWREKVIATDVEIWNGELKLIWIGKSESTSYCILEHCK